MTDHLVSRRRIAAAAAGMMAATLPLGHAHAQAQPFRVYFARESMMAASAIARRLVSAIKDRIPKGAAVTLTAHCDATERDPDKLSLGRAMEIHGMFVGLGIAPETKFEIVAKGAAEATPNTDPENSNPRDRRVDITFK